MAGPATSRHGPALLDAWNLAHPTVSPAPTFGVHDRGYLAAPARYDFFFVGGNIANRVASVAVDGACTASDHQPVVLEITG